MAPRAGFEVDRKVLSAHVATCVDELNTPRTYPTSLEPGILHVGERRNMFAGWPNDTVSRGAVRAPGFGKW
jgi:hypothetical protein